MPEYKAVTAVWETTMACNMRCMHCGSACATALPDELTTEQALTLCDDLGKLELKWITLSGGGPLTRKDWPLLALRLKSNGIVANMITNGWLLDDETVRTMRDCGLGTVAISLDGVGETHDAIRKAGSFERNLKAFALLKKHGQHSGAITSINKKNMHQLPDIRDALIACGVNAWQLQICIPMGSMSSHRDELVDPDHVDGILDFCLETAMRQEITVYPADCLGYYTEKEKLVRMYSLGTSNAGDWAGCNAGTRGFGILHNGDVTGCTSIRDRTFVEGNILEKSIVDIWNAPDAFSWSRKMKKSDLDGACRTCIYGETCLGGCPNTRLTMNGAMQSENPYCAYRTAMARLKEKLAGHHDAEALFKTAERFAKSRSYQEAGIILEHLRQNDPDNVGILSLLGFAHFFMGNYEEAKAANEAVLAKDPEDSYANKGLGLCLHKLGRTKEGIGFLEKAVKTAPVGFMDPCHDLAAVYHEIGDPQSAAKVLSQLRQR